MVGNKNGQVDLTFCFSCQDEASSPKSDWERFAAEHYEILVAEEQCEEEEDPEE